jgi:hypothetical protein
VFIAGLRKTCSRVSNLQFQATIIADDIEGMKFNSNFIDFLSFSFSSPSAFLNFIYDSILLLLQFNVVRIVRENDELIKTIAQIIMNLKYNNPMLNIIVRKFTFNRLKH